MELNLERENESIAHQLIRLSLPMLLAQLVQLLYNIVDRMFCGRIPNSGSLALAGLGITFPVIILIVGFASLVGVGGGNRAAIEIGKGNIQKAEKLLGNSLSLLVIFSAFSILVFFFFRNPILKFLGASKNTLPYASEYLGIYVLGTLFILLTSGLNTFITCQGFTNISMGTICIGCVLNIVLDPIFIFVFNMGVKGAALATVISQMVSAVWVLLFLTGKKTKLKIHLRNCLLSKELVGLILSIGISPFVMQASESLIQFAFFTGIKKFGNDDYSALMSILLSLTNVVWLSLSGFSQGSSPIIGFNFGARNLDKCRKTFKLLFKINLSLSLCIGGLMELFPGAFIALFTNDANLINLGRLPLRIFMAGSLLFGAQSSCQQTFLALGEAKTSLFLATLRKIILLFPLAMILPYVNGMGVWGLFFSESISDVLAVMTTVTMFKYKSKSLLY
jgi:putative MATE family efflux protein